MYYSVCRVGLGIVYPTFKSFQAIESAGKADDTQWLTYWVVYSFLQIVEKLAWVVLMWIPLYGLLKTVFLAWLVVPQFCGARMLYTMFIRAGLEAAACQLKDIPALEDVVKPFLQVESTRKKSGENNVAAVSHSAVGGITSVEKRTTPSTAAE